jgi:hypothetical protein
MPTSGDGRASTFDPGSVSDADRFGSGDMAKRPRASPLGIFSGCAGGAGIGLSARTVCLSDPLLLAGDGSRFGSTLGFADGVAGSGFGGVSAALEFSGVAGFGST